MARFDRPAGAINHYSEIRQWDVLWQAYGIVSPFVMGPQTVIRPPYRDGDDIRFETRKPRFKYVDRPFASDGNLIPGISYNDNYWFFTELEAQAAKEFFREQWTANPELKAVELEQRAERAREAREFERAYS